MKVWGEPRGEPDGGQPGAASSSEARLAAVAAEAGLDLAPDPARGHDHRRRRAARSPPPARARRAGPAALPRDRRARAPWARPSASPSAGPVGRSPRSPAATLARRNRFSQLVGGTRAFADATAILDEVELIILAVPDDALAPLAASLRLYAGQALVHTSGALGAEVLEPAMAAGTQIGSFHPLVAFADTERAVAALHGATIAVEGDDQLVALLAEMAEAIGATAVRLAPGSKSAYHAAAVLAAGGFVALLDAIAELGRVAGLDEAGSLAIYGPLIEQTLGNARALGIRAALTGPITRGDIGTLRAHLATLRDHAPGVLDLYRAAAEREIALAAARGALTPDAVAGLRDALAMRS